MKKIIINESQLNRVFLKEYLDKDFGMPLYRYLTMPIDDKIDICLEWGVESDIIYEFFTETDEGEKFLNYYVNKKLNDIINNNDELYDEEIEEYKQEIINDFYKIDIIQLIKDDKKLCYDIYNFIINYTLENEELYYEDAPAFFYYSEPTIIHNEWLIHFSDDAFDIALNGFKYGVNDFDSLAYSRRNKNYKNSEGYNFAFKATENITNSYEYGDEAVIFKANGVEVFHSVNNARQVIFYGPSANSIIYIKKGRPKGEIYSEYKIWQVINPHDNNIIYESPRINDIIKWVITNNAQPRFRMSQQYQRVG